MATPSRKRKVLTFEEKMDIVQRLENNEKANDIANHYDIGRSTVHEIMRNRKQLYEFCSSSLANEGMTKRRRVMRRPTHEYLEKCMHIWYIQERIKGLSITGPMITRKASYFDQLINGENTNFKASSGWLFRFKQRCGIAHLHAQLDLNAVMQKDISAFQEKLKALIRGKNLDESQVYYACEVRLSWKSLPEKVAQKLKSEALGAESTSAQERLTFLLCVNGTGSHKLPLLVIANPGTDTSQTENADLPSRLVSTDDACLDPIILKNWFMNGFIPAVKTESERRNIPVGAVLILESSPAHPFVTDELATEDRAIQAIFLPPNCTNTKLSLCSGLPETFKKVYRYAQVKKAFNASDMTKTQKENLLWHYTDNFNLETALQLSVDAWSDTRQEDILELWDEFFKNMRYRKNDSDTVMEKNKAKQSSVSEKILAIFQQHDIFKDIELADITDWVEKVDSFLLFPVLTDEEIIEKVRREIAAANNDEDSPPRKKRKPSFPSDSEALGLFEKCIRWLKNQPDANPESMKVLRSLKQKARDNIRNSEHVTTLSDVAVEDHTEGDITVDDITTDTSTVETSISETNDTYPDLSFHRNESGDLVFTVTQS